MSTSCSARAPHLGTPAAPRAFPARLSRCEPRALGARSLDVRRAAQRAVQHDEPARRRRPRHARPRRCREQADLPRPADPRRRPHADRGHLPALPRDAAAAARRCASRVRRRGADRLPLDAAARAQRRPARARRRPRRPLRHHLRLADRRSRRDRSSPAPGSASRATAPMPAALRPAPTAARSTASMRCRSRSAGTST